MKTSALTLVALSFCLLPLSAFAAQAAAPSDRASDQLTRHGSILVADAGPYVHVGTYLIQVSTKLGRPDARLPDGSWLYENFGAQNSTAHGTLVVRFENGRVSSLSLASPAVITALQSAPWSKPAAAIAATR